MRTNNNFLHATFMIRNILYNVFFFVCCYTSLLQGQTIAEKISGITNQGDLSPELQKALIQVNKELKDLRNELQRLYREAENLYFSGAHENEYKVLLDKISNVRENIKRLENTWRQRVSSNGTGEQYALWHQPDVTLGDIIIDYGSQQYVYLIGPELAQRRLSINSSLPIPRASWDEMLETILIQNGIGIKQLNPYLRQLYSLKEDTSPVTLITNKRADLAPLPGNTRVSFVISPDPSEVRRIWLFLERFVNPNSTVLQNIGREILVIGTVNEIRELLKLYDFAIQNQGTRNYRIIPLKRADVEEMSKVLSAIFDQFSESTVVDEEGKSSKSVSSESNGLQVIPLKNIAPALFLIGTEEELRKATKIIKEVESQIAGSKEKVIYVYKTKHSNADDIAKVLDKMYLLMIKTGAGIYHENGDMSQPPPPPMEGPPGMAPPGLQGAQGVTTRQQQGAPPGGQSIVPVDTRQDVSQGNMVSVQMAPPPPPIIFPSADQIINTGFYEAGQYLINPAPIGPLTPPKERSREPDRNNFIVDAKTGSILMVVEADTLPRLKELLAKIDVPKRMVQIEVLLFEKRLTRQNNIGINILKIGDMASQTHATSAVFEGQRGIFNFFISRMKTESGIPAFDLIYSFLISQEDFQINSAPSVVTVNQTPAFISIQEEISLSTGAFLVNTESNNSLLKEAFTRAQYGITIKVTPSVHELDAEDCLIHDGEVDYVTLDSEILFDTIQRSIASPNRPDVIRRKLTNLVRVPDGQSVIIGGLRRKLANDSKESIPFLGEVPGIGKLFSHTAMEDRTTEMFLVITPRIIRNPLEDFERLKWMEITRRPGDLPEFLCILQEAREREKYRLLRGTMNLLFGPEKDRCEINSGEYCGW